MPDRAPLVTLTTDFGVQSQGVGIMEAVAYSIAPRARLIHLMHGLPAFNLIAAARTLETLRYVPLGFHVCVCDPTVGSDRRPIVCHVERGDCLIGPDNGVLIPATRVLGGVRSAYEISNVDYFNQQQVSPIFHGRDIFVPAAAHLANGVEIRELGPRLDTETLQPAPYEEATVAGRSIAARVIQINRFGSIHLNVAHELIDSFGLSPGFSVAVTVEGHEERAIPYGRTFSDVAVGEELLLKDDYGRLEIARNQGSFVDAFPVRIGDAVRLDLSDA